MSELPVAVDAMGGDHAPEAIVEGALSAHRQGHSVVLVGDPDAIKPLLPRLGAPPVVRATGAIQEGRPPTEVRRVADHPVRVAMGLVAKGEASAVVSCGDTGATLVSAVLDLGVLPGVERPAIASILPRSDGGRLVLLDAGANVDCRPELLVSFALIGSAYAEALGVESPRVGLLANGEEDTKGNMQVRATLPLLKSLPLNVVGNVEPTDAMAGGCDVLVCDGFVGNILLKSAEAAVTTAVQLLREEIGRHTTGRVGAALLRGTFSRFRERVAWDAHGGALLLGCGGLVVVGHGRANPESVAAAVRAAHEAAGAGVIERIRGGVDPNTRA